MRRLRTAALAAACAAALGAAPAAAAPLTASNLTPRGSVVLAPMTDLSFSARFDGDVESAQVRLARSPAVGDDGLLDQVIEIGELKKSPFGRTTYRWQLPALSELRFERGTFYWQVLAHGRDDSGAPTLVASKLQKVRAVMPAAWRARKRIDRRFGHPGRGTMWISTQSIPDSVSSERFASIVRSAAPRWGLRVGGWTDKVAGTRDGANVVGFAPALNGSPALGVTVQLGGTLTRGGQVIRRIVTDRDIGIRTDINWSTDPVAPPHDRFDLESVVIHELGHVAGNMKHTSLCGNGPMGPALGQGEWWHTPHDWLRTRCPLQRPRGLF